MVGRLVEQQHVGLLQQQAAQCHTAAFTSRKGVDNLVVGRALEGIHGAFEFGIDVPCVGGVEGILQFALALDEGIHLVGVFKYVGVGECRVYIVEFLKQVDDRLHTFAYDFDYRLAGGEPGFLFEITYGIAG